MKGEVSPFYSNPFTLPSVSSGGGVPNHPEIAFHKAFWPASEGRQIALLCTECRWD